MIMVVYKNRHKVVEDDMDASSYQGSYSAYW